MPKKSKRCISAILFFALASLLSLWAEDVRILNPHSGLGLGATVSMPKDGRPHAGIVLVSGSGAQDRDETVLGHKPFRALADTLSAVGYAVLRYDDRGVGESDSNPNSEYATTADLATDAIACLNYIDSLLNQKAESAAGKEQGRIPIGCIGHSEGGSIAMTLAAEEDSPVDFIVTLAAPAFRSDSIILDQVRIALEQAGQAQAWHSLYPTLRARYDMLMSPIPEFAAKASLYADVSSQPGAAMANQDRIKEEINMMASPWYRGMLRHDPSEEISSIRVPWLAINGEKDAQVLPANLRRITELNPTANTVLLPGINHILLEAPTGAVGEYTRLIGDIDPSVTSEIVKFLNNLYK